MATANQSKGKTDGGASLCFLARLFAVVDNALSAANLEVNFFSSMLVAIKDHSKSLVVYLCKRRCLLTNTAVVLVVLSGLIAIGFAEGWW